MKFCAAEVPALQGVLSQVSQFLTIDTSNEVGLRDRALLGTLAYTFARIGAVVNFKVEDSFQTGKRLMIRFSEKGGKETEIPVHPKLEELLDQYLEIGSYKSANRIPLSDCGRQDAKARKSPGDPNRCSQNAQTPAQRRRVVGCILSPFF